MFNQPRTTSPWPDLDHVPELAGDLVIAGRGRGGRHEEHRQQRHRGIAAAAGVDRGPWSTTASAITASNWLAMPNMGQIVSTEPAQMK